MAPVALLGWECGRGLGHAVPLIEIARVLALRGWRCVLALRLDLIPDGFKIDGVEVRQAPVWGENASTDVNVTRSSASMVDVLAEIGLSSAEWTANQISRWHTLFAELRPDLVIADFAPGLVLAARGRVPSLATGTGYVVPPLGLARFPPLHHFAEPVFAEDDVLATVNMALAGFGIPPIAALSDALTGDARCVCTLPFLDPYASLRDEPVSGPLLRGPIAPREADANEIFCYLREAPRADRLDDLVACLEDLPGRTVAFIPGLSAERRDWLRTREVEVIGELTSITRQLARSCVLVHLGGHGLATAGVLAGVPQVIVSFDVEKWLTARALVGRGLARHFGYRDVGVEVLHAGILSVLDDPVMDMESRRSAAEHERYRDHDVVAEIAEVCALMAA